MGCCTAATCLSLNKKNPNQVVEYGTWALTSRTFPENTIRKNPHPYHLWQTFHLCLLMSCRKQCFNSNKGREWEWIHSHLKKKQTSTAQKQILCEIKEKNKIKKKSCGQVVDLNQCLNGFIAPPVVEWVRLPANLIPGPMTNLLRFVQRHRESFDQKGRGGDDDCHHWDLCSFNVLQKQKKK